MSELELDALRKAKATLDELPEAKKFVDESIKKYRGLIPSFKPSNYDL